MERVFKLNLIDSQEFGLDGNRMQIIDEKQYKTTLNDYIIDKNGIIDGNKLQNDWFKEIDFDIFISHSHKDETLAKKLSLWLYDNFHLTAFIDSNVWGYSDDLLKEIDNKYCRSKNENNIYSYEKRNKSTSHIHMMLSVAIAQMINKSKCLFFLNTPNSISNESVIDGTFSPWIYYELSIANIIYINNNHTMLASNESLASDSNQIIYKTDLQQFTEIDIDTLMQWKKRYLSNKNERSLNVLYNLAK